MRGRTKNLIYIIFCLVMIVLMIVPAVHHHREQRLAAAKVTSSKITPKKSHHKEAVSNHMRTPIDWRKSSETVPYPDLSKVKRLWIKVVIPKNRVYLYDGNKVIYTMYCSAGVYKTDPKTGKKKSATPTGTFHVQEERGDHFFNSQVKVGANYYVSWHDHGQYLFHSVPTDANGHYIKKKAAKLGKSTGSHGCVRLSVADAKWMEHNLPTGTKVVIQD